MVWTLQKLPRLEFFSQHSQKANRDLDIHMAGKVLEIQIYSSLPEQKNVSPRQCFILKRYCTLILS